MSQIEYTEIAKGITYTRFDYRKNSLFFGKAEEFWIKYSISNLNRLRLLVMPYWQADLVLPASESPVRQIT